MTKKDDSGALLVADPFKGVRDHLTVARVSLTASKPRTDDLRIRVETIKRQLLDSTHKHYHGDPQLACDELEEIVGDLKKLDRVPAATAPGGAKLTQGTTKELLPGVAEAIKQLQSVIDLLTPMVKP